MIHVFPQRGDAIGNQYHDVKVLLNTNESTRQDRFGVIFTYRQACREVEKNLYFIYYIVLPSRT